MCKNCKNCKSSEKETTINIVKSYWYGSCFDDLVFDYYWNIEELEKLLGMTQYDMIYKPWYTLSKEKDEYNPEIEYTVINGLYKQWSCCHICNKNIIEWFNYNHSFYNSINAIIDELKEEVTVIWPIDDSYWTHEMNVCEDCMKKYFLKYIN